MQMADGICPPTSLGVVLFKVPDGIQSFNNMAHVSVIVGSQRFATRQVLSPIGVFELRDPALVTFVTGLCLMRWSHYRRESGRPTGFVIYCHEVCLYAHSLTQFEVRVDSLNVCKLRMQLC